jgi:hypothetical protein
MATPNLGHDHEANGKHRTIRRDSCLGRIEHAPQQLPPSFKLAPPASDSIPRRPRRTMSPARSETTSTTAPAEVQTPSDDTCYGYENVNLDQKGNECTQASKDMLEATRRKAGRRGSALGRLQQYQSMESDKSGGGQECSSERVHSPSSGMFRTNSRRPRSAPAADLKWSDTAHAAPPQSPSRRRMSVDVSASTSRDTAHAAPPQSPSRRRMSVVASLFPGGRSSKNSDRNTRSSRSNTDSSTRSSRSNPDTSGRSSPSTTDLSTCSSQSNPNLSVGDSRPGRRTGRKRIDQRGNAVLGKRQDGWNGQAPNQTPDTVTLDRLQGLAQMKLVKDRSIMSLMSKGSTLSKESGVSKDSQASRDYGIPWWPGRK